MKTNKTLRNAVLTVMLVLVSSVTFSQKVDESPINLDREKAEFAQAGYWIDAVMVSTVAKSDRELLANKGYYIEPVVVTYKRTVPDYFRTPDNDILFTLEKVMEDLEVSMINNPLTY
jgi:hypothetical protein